MLRVRGSLATTDFFLASMKKFTMRDMHRQEGNTRKKRASGTFQRADARSSSTVETARMNLGTNRCEGQGSTSRRSAASATVVKIWSMFKHPTRCQTWMHEPVKLQFHSSRDLSRILLSNTSVKHIPSSLYLVFASPTSSHLTALHTR